MNTTTLIPNEIRAGGVAALQRELGTVGVLKFMHQFGSGHSDYSRERHAAVDQLPLESIVKQILKRRK